MSAWFAIIGVVCILVGGFCGYIIAQKSTSGKLRDAREEAGRIINNAQTDAEKLKQEAEAEKKASLLEVKEEIIQQKQEAEKEERDRQKEIRDREKHVISRENSIDNRSNALDKREQKISTLEGQVTSLEKKAQNLVKQRIAELEKVSSITSEEARELLLKEVKDDVTNQAAAIIRESEAHIDEEVDRYAQDIISVAIQRYASDYTADSTVTSVAIPSDELKGRIIGREGRNIRSFESVSGVNLIIDDTPETVILSSFDPVRRETARVALEYLIADGRIHPSRIEEMYNKAQAEVIQKIRKFGDEATYDVGIHDMKKELKETLGKLHFRTSYGQNVLQHSMEVAYFCGMMARELGLDQAVAKRAGLLHDLGKAIDHELDGPHAVLGAELARKHGESPEVVHAIESHHNDIEPKTALAHLVIAADAISAARPGARRESAELYIKRLEQLEEISNSFPGVERTYVMQAGREIRVMVKPEEISDNESTVLAHNIASEIEGNMQYPGQVKVVVIRESRAIDTAK